MPRDRCARCRRFITDEESALAWPVPMEDGYICPTCYGDEAFCREGHTLRGDVDSSSCDECVRASEEAEE